MNPLFQLSGRRGSRSRLPALLLVALALGACGEEDGVSGATTDTAGEGPVATDVVVSDGSADVGGQDTSSASDAAGCVTDADCSPSGDLCAPHRCVAGACAAVAVTCDTSGDTACGQTACDPSTGSCVTVPAPKGTPCVDGDPCTVEDRCKDGACVGGAVSACECTGDADCSGGDDKCLGSRYCDQSVFPYRCRVNPATVVVCADKKTSCQQTACNPANGKCEGKALPDGAICDDDDPCSVDDTCVGGTCKGKANVCVCTSDADCDALEDGDVCNGTLFCDKSTATCKVNPATTIVCQPGQDTACVKNQCNPATGQCALGAVKNGAACDDGDACTTGDLCMQGTCTGGALSCPCTSDASCKAKDDGDLCNGTLVCDKTVGKCVFNAATVVTCPSALAGPCEANVCQTLYGPTKLPVATTCVVQAAHEGDACDDGDACTKAEICTKGTCGGGQNTCKCTQDSECASQDDGDLCNGTMFCNKQVGVCEVNPATVVTCKTVDDTACLQAQCQPKTGKCLMQPTAAGSPCDDKNPCTKGDYCVLGQCNPGVLTCACSSNLDCLAQDDGDLCNGVPYCDKSDPAKPVCKQNPVSVVVCPSASAGPCATNACDPKSGKCVLAAKPDGLGCDDGTVCTTKDACAAGQCAGAPLNCDDGDGCTFDSCDPKKGCQHGAKVCGDGNPCTLDVCNSKTGACSFPPAPKGKSCDADGDGCTVGDACLGGSCVAGGKASCSSTPGVGACESAVCVSKGASSFTCAVVARPDGAACDDGGLCTFGGACKGGTCKPGTQERLFSQALAPGVAGAVGVLEGVAVDTGAQGAGVVVAVGAWAKGSGAIAGQASGWWLVRRDGAGKALAERRGALGTLKLAGQVLVTAHAVAPLASGGQVVVGAGEKGGALVGRVQWVGAKLEKLAEAELTPSAGHRRLFAGVPQIDGTAWVAGSEGASLAQGSAGYIARVSTSGKALWQLTVPGTSGKPGAGHKASLRGLRLRQDGVAVAAGWHTAESATSVVQAWLVAVNASGKLLWQRHAGTAGSQRLWDLRLAAGGGVVGYGARAGSAGDHPLVLRWDADGGLIGDLQGAGQTAIRRLALGPKGRHLAVGHTATVGGAPDGWLAGLDDLGNAHWQRTFGTLGADSVSDAAWLDSRTAVAVGHTTAQGQDRGLVRHVSAFGQASCPAAGPCAGKTAAGCDDGKPCTLDGCEGKSGCVAANASGAACSLADGCILDGTCGAQGCQPGQRSRLFLKSVAGPPLAQVGGAVTLPGGGVALAGCTTDNKLWIGRTDRFGLRQTPPTAQGLVAAACAQVRGLVALADGSLSLLVRHPTATHKSVRLRVLPDNKVAWSVAPADESGKGSWPVALVQIGGGTQGLQLAEGTHQTYWYTSPRYWPRLSRVDLTTGKLLAGAWSLSTTKIDGMRYRPRNLRAIASGGAMVAGSWQFTKEVKSQPAGWVQRTDSAGKAVWNKLLKQSGPSTLVDIAPAAGQTWWAVGTVTQGGSQRSWLVQLSSTGDVLLDRRSKSAVDFLPAALGVGTGGRFWIAGDVGVSKRRLWTGYYDSYGNPLTQHTHGTLGGVDDRRAAQTAWPLPDGGLLRSGSRSVNGVNQALLARVDPWGHADCLLAGGCTSQTVSSCDDGDACTTDACDPKKGCVAAGLTCEDGSACTKPGACKAGVCTNPDVDCDDGKVCTDDSCQTDTGCSHVANTGTCVDGDACTQSERCKDTVCHKTPVQCGDGVACTDDACDPKTGCTHKALAKGASCTTPCGAGTCGAQGCTLSQTAAVGGWRYTTPALSSADAVAYDGKGGFLVAGCTTSSALELIRVGADGSVAADVVKTGLDAVACQSVAGLVALADGGAVVLLNDAGKGTSRLLRVNAQLQEVWRVTKLHTAGNVTTARELRAIDGGKRVRVAQWVQVNPYLSASWRRVHLSDFDVTTGKSVWTGYLHPSGKAIWYRSHDVHVASDGATVVSGTRRAMLVDSRYHAWLARWGADRLLQWQWVDPVTSPKGVKLESFAYAAAALPDKSVVAAGEQHDNAATAQLLVRLDVQGKLQWRRLHPGSDRPRAIVGVGASRLLVAGHTTSSKGAPALYASWIDPLGQVHARREFGVTAGAGVVAAPWSALTQAPGGGFALLGTESLLGKNAPYLVRLDRWAIPACLPSAGCAKLTTCDDSDACTLDLCDPTSGACAGSKRTCDDSDAQTTDTCDKSLGCQHK